MPTWSMAAPAVSAAFFCLDRRGRRGFLRSFSSPSPTFRGWRPAAVGTAAALGRTGGAASCCSGRSSTAFRSICCSL